MEYGVIGRETIGTLTASIGFTAANIPPTQSRTRYAVIQAIDAAVRFCIDGTAPEADTTGMRLTKDSKVEVWGGEAMENFRCIEDGTTAKLEVVYMGTRSS